MGRREQKERERQRAAASCQVLERFLSKKSKTGEASSELNDSSVQNEMQPRDAAIITDYSCYGHLTPQYKSRICM